MAEASSARPLVEPKETAENNMDNEDALEIDRAADEERSKKNVSFGESLMPFKKPEFNPATMTGPDMMFQQVFVLLILFFNLEFEFHTPTHIRNKYDLSKLEIPQSPGDYLSSYFSTHSQL
jgi:hypothetical protein